MFFITRHHYNSSPFHSHPGYSPGAGRKLILTVRDFHGDVVINNEKLSKRLIIVAARTPPHPTLPRHHLYYHLHHHQRSYHSSYGCFLLIAPLSPTHQLLSSAVSNCSFISVTMVTIN